VLVIGKYPLFEKPTASAFTFAAPAMPTKPIFELPMNEIFSLPTCLNT